MSDLSERDEQDLVRSHRDLSDIDPATLQTAREREARAYRLAREIIEGTREPL